MIAPSWMMARQLAVGAAMQRADPNGVWSVAKCAMEDIPLCTLPEAKGVLSGWAADEGITFEAVCFLVGLSPANFGRGWAIEPLPNSEAFRLFEAEDCGSFCFMAENGYPRVIGRRIGYSCIVEEDNWEYVCGGGDR